MAFIKFALSAALLACASAMPQNYGPPAPSYGPAPLLVQEPIVAPNYNFQYGVADAETGQSFSHNENRNNYDTAGEYRVNLPDGRVQIVSYHADEAGYVADVKYEGEAVYPAEPIRPAYNAPAPAVVAVAPAPAPRIIAAAPRVLAPAPVAFAPAPLALAPAPAPLALAPAPAPLAFAPAPAVFRTAPVFQAAIPVRARTFGFRTLENASPAPAPEAEAAAQEIPAPEAAAPAPVEEAAPAPIEAAEPVEVTSQ